MNEKNNVPQWILESKTGIEEQNDEVGMIVAGFIGAFVKRGFDQKEIGMLMAQAFLLPLEEVEKRVDVILSCNAPISVASVGWYPTAEGILPSRAETSEPACVKR